MKKNVLKVAYPEELLLSLKENKEEFEKEAKLLLAMKFYELGKISSGKAAKLAGVSRVEFLSKLGQYKISPFQVDLDEIIKESNK